MVGADPSPGNIPAQTSIPYRADTLQKRLDIVQALFHSLPAQAMTREEWISMANVLNEVADIFGNRAEERKPMYRSMGETRHHPLDHHLTGQTHDREYEPVLRGRIMSFLLQGPPQQLAGLWPHLDLCLKDDLIICLEHLYAAVNPSDNGSYSHPRVLKALNVDPKRAVTTMMEAWRAIHAADPEAAWEIGHVNLPGWDRTKVGEKFYREWIMGQSYAFQDVSNELAIRILIAIEIDSTAGRALAESFSIDGGVAKILAAIPPGQAALIVNRDPQHIFLLLTALNVIFESSRSDFCKIAALIDPIALRAHPLVRADSLSSESLRWFDEKRQGALRERFDEMRVEWRGNADGVEKRLRESRPFEKGELDTLMPLDFQSVQRAHLHSLLEAGQKKPWGKRVRFADLPSSVLFPDPIQGAYHVLTEEVFHMGRAGNIYRVPDLISKLGFLDRSKKKAVLAVLKNFMRYRDEVVRIQFPLLADDTDALSRYLARTVTPETLRECMTLYSTDHPPSDADLPFFMLKSNDPGIRSLFSSGDYYLTLDTLIAEGGMSRVFEGKLSVDPDGGDPPGMGHILLEQSFGLTKNDLAVKLLKVDPSLDDAGREREIHLFLRESTILERLQAIPAVVRLVMPAQPYEKTGIWFMAMERLRGDTLTELMEVRGVPDSLHQVQVNGSIALAIAHAIDKIHGHGIIHRDLKPDNIIVPLYWPRPDQIHKRVRIFDFGIAKIIGETHVDLTARGTPAFVSPQQVRDFAGSTVQTDIYAFGAILYWMFTGRVLQSPSGRLIFAPTRRTSVLTPRLQTRLLRIDAAEEPRLVNPEVPEALNQIIMRALQTDIRRRYGSMADVIRDLENLLHIQ